MSNIFDLVLAQKSSSFYNCLFKLILKGNKAHSFTRSLKLSSLYIITSAVFIIYIDIYWIAIPFILYSGCSHALIISVVAINFFPILILSFQKIYNLYKSYVYNILLLNGIILSSFRTTLRQFKYFQVFI